MFKNQMLNIVISSKSREEVEFAVGFKELLMGSLESILMTSDYKVTEISSKNYLVNLKESLLGDFDGLKVTVTIDDKDSIKVGSHSDRFHSLELAEKNHLYQVTNIQYNINSIPQIFSFSTVNSELAILISKGLNDLHQKFSNEQLTLGV